MSQLESRPRDSDRKTRVHLSLFDRAKFLLLFGLVFLILVWAAMASDPLLSLSDAAITEFNARLWIIVLAGVEVIRQIHFFFAEKAAGYHSIWQRYFAFVDKTIHRISDWNRYRLSRAIKALLMVGLLAVVLGAI